MRRQLRRIMICMLMVFALQFVMGVNAKPVENGRESKNIVEFLKKNRKEYSTLEQALEAAGLTQTLEGEGPFTVFAPNNRAFEQLPKGVLENLLAPQNKAQLTDILTYHVAKGRLTAEDLTKMNGQELMMLNGKPAKIEVKDGNVYIDGAKVLRADVPVSNGVIHVIDTVIMP
ncbi:MAG: fasciclin domain-containing protein [Clostridium sp.]|nr:fasciclin domain-containing protein [Clostridium sp.]